MYQAQALTPIRWLPTLCTLCRQRQHNTPDCVHPARMLISQSRLSTQTDNILARPLLVGSLLVTTNKSVEDTGTWQAVRIVCHCSLQPSIPCFSPTPRTHHKAQKIACVSVIIRTTTLVIHKATSAHTSSGRSVWQPAQFTVLAQMVVFKVPSLLTWAIQLAKAERMVRTLELPTISTLVG